MTGVLCEECEQNKLKKIERDVPPQVNVAPCSEATAIAVIQPMMLFLFA